MQTPRDKTIVLKFASHPNKDPAMRWLASLTFPPFSTRDTILSLAITDGNNSPIASAIFEIASNQVAIKNGIGAISYRDFVAGLHSQALWLHLPNQLPIPGGLTFG